MLARSLLLAVVALPVASVAPKPYSDDSGITPRAQLMHGKRGLDVAAALENHVYVASDEFDDTLVEAQIEWEIMHKPPPPPSLPPPGMDFFFFKFLRAEPPGAAPSVRGASVAAAALGLAALLAVRTGAFARARAVLV